MLVQQLPWLACNLHRCKLSLIASRHGTCLRHISLAARSDCHCRIRRRIQQHTELRSTSATLDQIS